MEVAPAMDNSGSAKRRKVGNGELNLSTLKSVRITGRDSDDAINTSMKEDLSGSYADEMSFISGEIPVTCSIDGSIMQKLKYADLEESAEKQIKTHTLSPNSMAAPTSEFKAESGDLQQPTAAELEEFFAAAEKDIQKRFKNKYNYDIVNDVPLKGRYEWIQLKR